MHRIRKAIEESNNVANKDLGIEWTMNGQRGSIVRGNGKLNFQNAFERKLFKIPNDW